MTLYGQKSWVKWFYTNYNNFLYVNVLTIFFFSFFNEFVCGFCCFCNQKQVKLCLRTLLSHKTSYDGTSSRLDAPRPLHFHVSPWPHQSEQTRLSSNSMTRARWCVGKAPIGIYSQQREVNLNLLLQHFHLFVSDCFSEILRRSDRWVSGW